MRRPHMKLGVGMLTSTYFESITDLKKLKELEYELTFRSTPRAAKLLDMVRKSIEQVGAKEGDDIGVFAHQPDLVPDRPVSNSKLASCGVPIPKPEVASHSSPGVEQISRLQVVPGAVPDVMSSPDPTAVSPLSTVKKLRTPLSGSVPAKGRSIGDSYKVFHASAETPWETIELARRKLIERSNPILLGEATPAEQQHIMDEAKQINAAYVVLSLARCARR